MAQCCVKINSRVKVKLLLSRVEGDCKAFHQSKKSVLAGDMNRKFSRKLLINIGTVAVAVGILITYIFQAVLKERFHSLYSLGILTGLLGAVLSLGYSIRDGLAKDDADAALQLEPKLELLPPPEIFPSPTDAWDGGFNPDDPKYPVELDIALQAWRTISNGKSEAPVREQLSGWLKASYPDLSSAAVDRIVGVCNWDKTGGRPKNLT